ncbi:MAG: hypothetical protein AAF986_05555 [Pseudomonadota bacterium]
MLKTFHLMFSDVLGVVRHCVPVLTGVSIFVAFVAVFLGVAFAIAWITGLSMDAVLLGGISFILLCTWFGSAYDRANS